MTTDQPRVGDTITTVAQLNALPEGAVLRAHKKNRKSGLGRLIQAHGEAMFSVDGVYEFARKVDLPATVLYVPGEQPSPSVENARAAEVLAAHQRQSIGMTASSPDHCSCGEAVPPEPDLTTSGPAPALEGRRYRAFAAHQAAALAASRAVPSDHTATTEDAFGAAVRVIRSHVDEDTAIAIASSLNGKCLLATARPDTTTEARPFCWLIGDTDGGHVVYDEDDANTARTQGWTVIVLARHHSERADR